MRRHAANYHDVCLMGEAERRGLWRAVSGYQPGFADHGLFAGNAQAGSFEIRPCLLRAVAPDGADIKPVALGKRLRHAGFDLRGKSGKKGERGSDKRSNSDS